MSTFITTFIACIITAVVVFFFSRWMFKNELKKNPPINEKMIRAMFREMGRKPNEAQIRRIMKNINDSYK
ncbi:YneF family protein [Kandleria vitulina]|jgi:uncharacterized protein YneF (UPF0154 family)|uniref:YneF family protein n=1 Tax=Kandleria vitulina TaxID=1630 RepID=UPI0004E23279|nr:YneF family protein [Kandleria vitulina]SEI74949.1 hypothetical protein SAMN05216514_10337 [Kandleria vitulina]HAD22853.1 hypothetical protein [Kandleria vitulina]